MTLIVRNLELRHSDTNELTNIARSNRQQSVDCTGLQERLRCPCVDGHFGTVRTELDAFFCHALGTQKNNKLHQFAHFQQTSLQTLTTYNNECFQLSQRDLAFICLLHVAAEMRFAICKPGWHTVLDPTLFSAAACAFGFVPAFSRYIFFGKINLTLAVCNFSVYGPLHLQSDERLGNTVHRDFIQRSPNIIVSQIFDLLSKQTS